jgi:hypothetical protein
MRSFFSVPPRLCVIPLLSPYAPHASMHCATTRSHEPGPKGPVFMTFLERTFGKDITTRTLDTVRKCAMA